MGRAMAIAVALAVFLGGAGDVAARPHRARRTARARPAATVAPGVGRVIDADAARRLGRANQAYRAGDFDAAYTLAAPLASAKLAAHDYAVWLAAESAYLSGRRSVALGWFRKAIGKGRFAAITPWRIADCQWDLGQSEAARKAYEVLLKKPGEAGDRAVALFRVGEANRRARRMERASLAFHRLVVEDPLHPLAAQALTALEAAGQHLSPRDRIARAEVMTRSRAWDEALAELARLGKEMAGDLATLRDYWTGETLFKMRRQYARAGELLVSVHEQMGHLAAQALFHGARALSRADRDDEAIRLYGQVVAKYPKSDFADEAQFLSGWLELNRGAFGAAIPPLEKLLVRYPGSKFADDALWYLGYAHLLAGEPADALPYLDRLARQGGALEGGKARYWRARALATLDRDEEATRELRALVGDYPFSWYSQLARSRLREHGVVVGPFGDRASGTSSPPRLGSIDPAVAAETAVLRADELTLAGMGPEAGHELARAEGSLIARYGAARALPVLVDRYRKAGNFNRPWMLAVVHGARALDQPPTDTTRAWWEHAYPLAYRELVEKHEHLGDNPPYYLYAIMRKESGFNPHDVSYADAIGLLQMIPPTTRRVAPNVGLEYTDDLLFEPELNIKVGSWYIGNLAAKFRRQIPIAAGSFNCGPGPVMRWLDQFGDRPIDEFVERVAYTQTREYMKKVAEGYARYLYLYAGTDYQQPLVVDRAYVKNDLDY